MRGIVVNGEGMMDIFDSMEPRKWKGKYPVSWCNLCDCAYIDCPEESCHGTSCNGGGCPKCHDDTTEFNRECKTNVEDYLTEEEKKVYRKCLEIKKLILESIRNGDNSIDLLKMQKNGELSQYQEEVFGLIGGAEKVEPDIYKKRMEWLHDCRHGTTDADGYEWGVYRVKWENGKPVDVQATLSDFSDIDNEMKRESKDE